MSDATLNAESIQEIERLVNAAEVKVISVNGIEFTTGRVWDNRKPEEMPKPLVVHTLDALIEYIQENVDELLLDGGQAFIHVVDPTRVDVCSHLSGDFNQRATFLRAEAYTPDIKFGRYMGTEDFCVMMQALFADDGDRAPVLATAGNITAGATRQVEDDGVTQQVTARAGIARVANVTVPNPVRLLPYRSFREIVQPESEFIFRMRGGDESTPPTCALFEADGGLWRLTAVRRIKDYLSDRIKSLPILG